MAMRAPRTTPQRADAARNRERILAAARGVLADPTADASMAELARRAGVGMATLYRNFASRRDLLEALYEAEVAELCAAATAEPGWRGAGGVAAPLRGVPPQ